MEQKRATSLLLKMVLLMRIFRETLSAKHQGGSLAEMNTVFSIVNSLTLNFPEIKRVQILIEDRAVETLNGHMDLSRPLRPDPTLVASAPRQQKK